MTTIIGVCGSLRHGSFNGMLIVTPEYNASMPGVLKMPSIGCHTRRLTSRASLAGDRWRSWARLPAAWNRVVASGVPIVRKLGMRPWFEGGVLISDAARLFDSDGRVADAAARQRIRTFVEGFACSPAFSTASTNVVWSLFPLRKCIVRRLLLCRPGILLPVRERFADPCTLCQPLCKNLQAACGQAAADVTVRS